MHTLWGGKAGIWMPKTRDGGRNFSLEAGKPVGGCRAIGTHPVVAQLPQQPGPVPILHVLPPTLLQQRQEVAQGGRAVPVPPGQVARPPAHDLLSQYLLNPVYKQTNPMAG